MRATVVNKQSIKLEPWEEDVYAPKKSNKRMSFTDLLDTRKSYATNDFSSEYQRMSIAKLGRLRASGMLVPTLTDNSRVTGSPNDEYIDLLHEFQKFSLAKKSGEKSSQMNQAKTQGSTGEPVYLNQDNTTEESKSVASEARSKTSEEDGGDVASGFTIISEADIPVPNQHLMMAQSIKIEGVSFRTLFIQQQFNFRKDRKTRKKVEDAIGVGLSLEDDRESVFVRQHAYSLLLGIEHKELRSTLTKEYEDYIQMAQFRWQRHYQNKQEQKLKQNRNSVRSARQSTDPRTLEEMLDEVNKSSKCCGPESNACKIQNQITKDVPRTMGVFNCDKLDFPFESGMNPIFNLLTAYAEIDPQVGYTQGMNFLVGLLYLAVEDEVLAFNVLKRLMQPAPPGAMSTERAIRKHEEVYQEWRNCYCDSMPQLFDICTNFRTWLMKKHKILLVHLDASGIFLEAQFSSPVLALFANILPTQVALKILDNFIYYGEQEISKILQTVFAGMKTKILAIKDPFELQIFLTKAIWLEALEKDCFFPPTSK